MVADQDIKGKPDYTELCGAEPQTNPITWIHREKEKKKNQRVERGLDSSTRVLNEPIYSVPFLGKL